MKRILFSILIILLSVPVCADEVDDMGKIVISVNVPETSSPETIVLKDYLLDKMAHWLSVGGYTANGMTSFYVSPNITIDDVASAEGGMKTVYVVKGTLYLKITQEKDGIVFSSIDIPFRESHTKKESAIKTAMGKIQAARLKPMLDEAREKIIKYYETEKLNIFAEAERYTRQKDYDAAIATLMTIPSCLTSTYHEALERADKVLDKKVINYNDSILAEARSLMAQHKVNESLDVLIYFRTSPQESQNTEYATIVQRAESLITAAELAAIREKQQRYLDAKAREERQWAYAEKEQTHRMTMEHKQMEYQREKLASNERITNKRIASNERLSSQKMASDERLSSQRIAASERLVSQNIASQERLSSQRIRAIKEIAVSYNNRRRKTIIINHNY